MLTGIVLLLLVGLLLLMAEVFLVPGVTFVGIAGVLLMFIGVWMAYSEYGQTTGHYVLLASLTISSYLLIRAFRSGFWGTFALKSTLEDAHSPEPGQTDTRKPIMIGMSARAVSRLRPMGLADFNGEIREVELSDGWAEPGEDLIVSHIDFHKIFVQLKPTNPSTHV